VTGTWRRDPLTTRTRGRAVVDSGRRRAARDGLVAIVGCLDAPFCHRQFDLGLRYMVTCQKQQSGIRTPWAMTKASVQLRLCIGVNVCACCERLRYFVFFFKKMCNRTAVLTHVFFFSNYFSIPSKYCTPLSKLASSILESVRQTDNAN
jgi:hypothetical protein